MSDPNWDSGVRFIVPAKPKSGYWTMVVEYVDASKRLKFIVEDVWEVAPATQDQQAASAPQQATAGPQPVWTYANGRTCTADGDPKAPINPENCLLKDAPPGALIAKIGGSTAGKSDGIRSFVVGSFCVIDLDDKTKGALYLTMNADPMDSQERSGQLPVKVYHSYDGATVKQ